MSAAAGLKRIVVIVSVAAFAVAAVCDVVLAFSPELSDLRVALVPAALMMAGAFGMIVDFENNERISRRFARHPMIEFLATIWASLVVASAGALYPVYGVQIWKLEPLYYIMLTTAVWLIPVLVLYSVRWILAWIAGGFAS